MKLKRLLTMDKNRHYKIALVLYTSGIDYDDRIRKEILSITEMYPNISFKIFAVDSKNREEKGITSYGVPYRIPYLKSRNKYASGTHTLQKAWDFYKTIKKDLRAFDAIWCADPETFMFVLMLHGKPIAWDLHELPLVFMRNPLMKYLFKYLENKCNVMVHANNARLQFLYKNGYVKHLNRQFYLRNYPLFNEIDSEYDERFKQFTDWKGNSKCVYLQGLMGPDRADVESIESVLAINGLKAVVVGKILPDRMKIFEEKFGKNVLDERVFFTGQIKQLKTPQYIRQCFTSLIFYKNTSPNNWLCEPNRMFQNVINGNPVVVGCNPSMKEYVTSNEFGISVDTDGTNVEMIIAGLKQLISNYDFYKKNVQNLSDQMMWNSQNDTIRMIIEKFI